MPNATAIAIGCRRGMSNAAARGQGALVAAAGTTTATIRPNQSGVYNPRSETTATMALRSLALPMKYNDTPPAPYTGKKL